MQLTDSVKKIPQISEGYAKRLDILGIKTIQDLITHFPRSYIDSSDVIKVQDLLVQMELETDYTIRIMFKGARNMYLRKGLSIQTAIAEDETGSIKCTWFNQPFLAKSISQDAEYYVIGRLKKTKNTISFQPKNFEKILEDQEQVHSARIVPEYRLTSGVSKKWLRNRIKWLVDNVDSIEINDNFKDINIKECIKNVHFPDNFENLEEARKKLTLLELAEVHLRTMSESKGEKERSKIVFNNSDIDKSIIELEESLDFKLTEDQSNAIDFLKKKFINKEVVNGIVQGDVGSGKTIIAIFSSLMMAKNGYQTIVLAPTTVLAKQHFENFKQVLEDFSNIRIGLITGTTSIEESRENYDIVIGTTAVLSRKDSLIENVGLIIVDEQHKFGVKQRQALTEFTKENDGINPHFLDMTATPIPRTLAETFFSDIDIISIRQKPVGRIPIKTFLVPELKRQDAYTWVKNIVKEGSQIFWLCPTVEDSEKLQVKSATGFYKELTSKLKGIEIGLLHGKLKNQEKTQVIENFKKKKIDILVSTTVIEVGIDVPNATVMAIESAERFGLAQLHQLRGRVGRGTKQSYCLLFYNQDSDKSVAERLRYFAKNQDGLKIAEFDLERRGPGEVYGTKQAGIPDLKIARLNDIEVIKKSKILAQTLMKKNIRHINLFRKTSNNDLT